MKNARKLTTQSSGQALSKSRRKHHVFGTRVVLTFLLLISLCLGTVPMSVFATGLSSSLGVASASEPTILYEKTFLRSAYEKHFLLSNGKSVVYSYDQPVHYLKDGVWTEVDNTLVFENDSYVNRSASFSASFASSADSDSLFSFTMGDYGLSLSLPVMQTAVSAVSRNTLLQERSFEGKTAAQANEMDITHSSLKYENLLSGMDIEYSLSGGGVKEDIYLDSAAAWQDLTFSLTLTALTPQLLADGSVSLKNAAGQEVFTMAPPYMYDAAGEISHAVTYKLTSRKNGYNLTLDADERWLNASNRTYPVVVDPSVSVSGSGNVVDTMIREGKSTGTYGSMKYMVVGYSTTSSNRRNRGLIKMSTLPTIPSGNSVVSATLTLRQLSAANDNYSWSNDNIASTNVGLSKVTSSWSTSTSWSTMPTFNTAFLDVRPFNATTENETATFHITEAVQEWYAGQANHGLMVRATDDANSSPANVYLSFYTTEHTTAANKPVFAIYYASATGDETEPNNTAAAADVLSFTYPSLAVMGSYTGLIADSEDVDFVRFTMNETVTANIKLFVPEEEEYTVYVYNDAAGSYLIKYGDEGIGETVNIPLVLYKGTTYCIKIFSSHGSYSAEDFYTLTINYATVVDSNAVYTIKNVNSGKALSIPRTTSSTAIQHTYGGAYEQKFVLSYSDGGYFIKTLNMSDRPGKSLELPNESDVNGTDLTFAQDANAPRQKFCLIELPNGNFHIMPSQSSNKYLEVTYSSSANGAVVQIYQDSGQSCLEWEITKVDNSQPTKSTISFFSIGDDNLEETEENGGNISPYYWLINNTSEYEVWNTRTRFDPEISNDALLAEMTESDVVYIETHGDKPDNSPVESYYFTYYHPNGENQIVLNSDIGTTFTNTANTTTNTPFRGNTKWTIMMACSQLNSGTTANYWAKALLGDYNRMHGVLGYYGIAPQNSGAARRMVDFYANQRASYSNSMLESWQYANESCGSTSTWAVVMHETYSNDAANVADENMFSGFGADLSAGSAATIYRYAYDDDETQVQFTANRSSQGALAAVRNVALTSEQTNAVTCILGTKNNSRLQMDANGRVIYHDDSINYSSRSAACNLTDAQIITQAENQLSALSLLPDEDYIVSVSRTSRERFDAETESFVEKEIVGYTVYFRHASNGRAIETEDENEGILLRFTADGLKDLEYHWGELITQ